MPNAWVIHVKQFASDNNLSYGCALSTPACKETYQRVKQMDKLSKLIREGKFTQAKEVHDTLKPLLQAMPEAQRTRDLKQLDFFRKAILRSLNR